jgi:hypothetical protein
LKHCIFVQTAQIQAITEEFLSVYCILGKKMLAKPARMRYDGSGTKEALFFQ